jgi:CheY-like chemotaxis protein
VTPADETSDCRAASAAGDETTVGPAASRRPIVRPRILVVDDELDTLILTEAWLAKRGYDVHLASSGGEALDRLAEPFDAVLLDVMMPEMSGLEVLARLRETPRLARTPVILLTARRRDRDLLEGYGRGADYYIPKPCTVGQIEYGLRLVLGRRSAG